MNSNLEQYPDLFEYTGNGLIAQFLTVEFISNIRDIIKSFYANPKILQFNTSSNSYLPYYKQVAEWLTPFISESSNSIIKPFICISNNAFLLGYDHQLVVDINYKTLEMVPVNSLPTDERSISYASDIVLDRYISQVSQIKSTIYKPVSELFHESINEKA